MTDDQWTKLRSRLEEGMSMRDTGNVTLHFMHQEVLELDWHHREKMRRLDEDRPATGTDG